MPRTFPCPRCGKPSTWEGNEFRPFCSERCRLIDLGAWSQESYRIPVENCVQEDELNVPTSDVAE